MAKVPKTICCCKCRRSSPENERAKIAERSRRGKLHAARQGNVNVLSGAPLGYRYVTAHEGGGQARYEVVWEEARIVQQMFAWVGRERVTWREVCRRLEKQGILTRTGSSRWSAGTVAGMLKNRAYLGEAQFGKTRLVPSGPRKVRLGRGRPEVRRRAADPDSGAGVDRSGVVRRRPEKGAKAQDCRRRVSARRRKHLRATLRGNDFGQNTPA